MTQPATVRVPTPRGVAALAITVAIAVAVGATGCAIPPASTSPGPGLGQTSAAGVPTAPASPTPTPSPTPTTLPPSVPASPGATQLTKLPDQRTGSGLNKPLIVRGLPLINRDHGVSKKYAPKLDEKYRLVPAAAKDYGRMVAAAKKAGLTIVWRVGYRSYATQLQLSKNPPSVYGSKASQYVARPGHSEHQAGLAVDVASPRGSGTNFPKTKEFAWLRANAHSYGFILRYPDGKTAITGYRYESWHYRYIGPDAAAAFGPRSSLTLEEYLGGR